MYVPMEIVTVYHFEVKESNVKVMKLVKAPKLTYLDLDL